MLQAFGYFFTAEFWSKSRLTRWPQFSVRETVWKHVARKSEKRQKSFILLDTRRMLERVTLGILVSQSRGWSNYSSSHEESNIFGQVAAGGVRCVGRKWSDCGRSSEARGAVEKNTKGILRIVPGVFFSRRLFPVAEERLFLSPSSPSFAYCR